MKKKIIICLIVVISITGTLFGCKSKSTDIEDIETSIEIGKENNENVEEGNNEYSSNNEEEVQSANNYSEEVHNKMLDYYNKVYARGLEISNMWNDGENDQLEERDSGYSIYKELLFSNFEHEDAVWENYSVGMCYVDAHGFDDDKSKLNIVNFQVNYYFKEDIDIANSPLKEIMELTLPNIDLDFNLINSEVKALPNINKQLPIGETEPYSISGYNNSKYFCEIDAVYAAKGGFAVSFSVGIYPEYFK